MKKIYSYFFVFIVSLFIGIFSINAKSKATLEIIAPTQVYTNDIFKVSVIIKNIDGNGIAGIVSKFNYDNENVEFISYEKNDFNFSMNESILKFGGLIYDENYITTDQTIITFTFKALNTSLIEFSLSEIDVVDSIPERTEIDYMPKYVKVIAKPEIKIQDNNVNESKVNTTINNVKETNKINNTSKIIKTNKIQENNKISFNQIYKINKYFKNNFVLDLIKLIFRTSH